MDYDNDNFDIANLSIDDQDSDDDFRPEVKQFFEFLIILTHENDISSCQRHLTTLHEIEEKLNDTIKLPENVTFASLESAKAALQILIVMNTKITVSGLKNLVLSKSHIAEAADTNIMENKVANNLIEKLKAPENEHDKQDFFYNELNLFCNIALSINKYLNFDIDSVLNLENRIKTWINS